MKLKQSLQQPALAPANLSVGTRDKSGRTQLWGGREEESVWGNGRRRYEHQAVHTLAQPLLKAFVQPFGACMGVTIVAWSRVGDHLHPAAGGPAGDSDY
jgi:hypothetical protein